jgi:hypothetical protein
VLTVPYYLTPGYICNSSAVQTNAAPSILKSRNTLLTARLLELLRNEVYDYEIHPGLAIALR